MFPFVSVIAHGILILQLERRQEIMLYWPMYMKFYAVNISSCNTECLPFPVLLAIAGNLAISVVKLSILSGVLSHLQPSCYKQKSKAKLNGMSTLQREFFVGKGSPLEGGLRCLSKCIEGMSVFCFQVLYCCFLSLVKADSFLPQRVGFYYFNCNSSYAAQFYF